MPFGLWRSIFQQIFGSLHGDFFRIFLIEKFPGVFQAGFLKTLRKMVVSFLQIILDKALLFGDDLLVSQNFPLLNFLFFFEFRNIFQEARNFVNVFLKVTFTETQSLPTFASKFLTLFKISFDVSLHFFKPESGIFTGFFPAGFPIFSAP